MILQSADIKLEWNASKRDSIILMFPTFEAALGVSATHLSVLLECRSLSSVGSGYQKSASELVDKENFLEHLAYAERLIKDNSDLLDWDYSVSFPDISNETSKSARGHIGSLIVAADCWPHGHAILKEMFIRSDGKGQYCGYKDLRACEPVITDDKGLIKINRRRVKTSIMQQLEFVRQSLEVSNSEQLILIPNPSEIQLDGAVTVL